jgi:hypothetical protein
MDTNFILDMTKLEVWVGPGKNLIEIFGLWFVRSRDVNDTNIIRPYSNLIL